MLMLLGYSHLLAIIIHSTSYKILFCLMAVRTATTLSLGGRDNVFNGSAMFSHCDFSAPCVFAPLDPSTCFHIWCFRTKLSFFLSFLPLRLVLKRHVRKHSMQDRAVPDRAVWKCSVEKPQCRNKQCRNMAKHFQLNH